MTATADDLRARHAEALAGFTGHRFFRAAADGSLSSAACDRYFVNERLFVGAARAIFAHLLIKAPTLAAARHLVGILDGLVNAQEGLFDDIFDRLELVLPEDGLPAPDMLGAGVIAIARDAPYAAGIAAMLSAEWSYLTVARSLDWDACPNPAMADWFRLHAEDDFAGNVTWLEAELERVWSPDVAEAVDAAFARTVALEIAFHDDPLDAA
jgi:thiaminase/transcriptional activator TenA